MAENLVKIDNWENYEKFERLLSNEFNKFELKKFIEGYAPEIEWLKFRPSVSLYVSYCFALLNYTVYNYVDEYLWNDIREYLQALGFAMLIDKANIKCFWDKNDEYYSGYAYEDEFLYKNYDIDDLISCFDERCEKVCVG